MIAISHIGNAPPETLPLRLEYLFTYRVGFRVPPEVIGPTPECIRMNFALTGGTVAGPRLNGTIRPGGSDFLAIRSDGVSLLDLHMTIATSDGALINIADQGVLDHGGHSYRHFLGWDHLPNGTPFHTSMRPQTAHPHYQWLHRLLCVGTGQVFPDDGAARCDVYALMQGKQDSP